jgi:aldehyde dehydrogenase (NAD+)
VCLWSENISLVMEVAYALQVGTIWINSVQIEKGVETRKMSGNYHVRGRQSLLNFLRPKWQKKFDSLSSNISLDTLLKSYGSVSVNATTPISENISNKKTYKLYIGGKQVRPDSQSSKSIYDGDKLMCVVGDAGRKDVRNAVEAASNAFAE